MGIVHRLTPRNPRGQGQSDVLVRFQEEMIDVTDNILYQHIYTFI
jgi:hypothetical protein